MEHNFFFIALALWLFLDVLWIFARPAFNLISITGSGKALFSFYLLFITFFFFLFVSIMRTKQFAFVRYSFVVWIWLWCALFEFRFAYEKWSVFRISMLLLLFCLGRCLRWRLLRRQLRLQLRRLHFVFNFFFLLFSNEWMNEWALTHSRSHPICTIRIVVFASVSFFAFLTFFLGLCLVRSRVALKSRKAWAPNATGRFDNAPTNGKKFAMKRNLYGWKAAQSAPAEQSIQRCCCCSYTRNNSLIFWILNQEYFQLGQKAPLSKFLKLKNNEKIKIYMNNNKKGIMYNNSNGGL